MAYTTVLPNLTDGFVQGTITIVTDIGGGKYDITFDELPTLFPTTNGKAYVLDLTSDINQVKGDIVWSSRTGYKLNNCTVTGVVPVAGDKVSVSIGNDEYIATLDAIEAVGVTADAATTLLGSHDHNGTTTVKLDQANTHQSPDTDAAQSSLHHTIESVSAPSNLAATAATGSNTTASASDHEHHYPDTLLGEEADGAGTVATKVGNETALTVAGAKIISFYNDNLTTEKAYIDLDGKAVFNGGMQVDSIDELTPANGVTIDGMNIMNDGTTTTFLGTTGDYNRIGDAGTTSHSLASEDDLLVTGNVEIDGNAYFDGPLFADDNTNRTLLSRVLPVDDDFSTTDTFNQWSKVDGTATSTISYSGEVLTITRNSDTVLTSGWYNRNSIGKNVVLSTYALHDNGSDKVINLRQTDEDNMLQVTVSSAGLLSLRRVVAGVASDLVTAVTIADYNNAASTKIATKVYDDLLASYILDEDGYVVKMFNTVSTNVGAQTGKIAGLGTGSSGDGVIYDNYHSHTMGQLVNIVALGDSNTSGGATSNYAPIRSTYPNRLANEFIDDDVVVWNKAVSGRQTTNVTAALSTDLYPNYIEKARNIATLLVGMGDFTLGGKTAVAAWADMETCISAIKADDWELIVFTYFPTKTDAAAGSNAFAKEFNGYIRANADVYNYKVIDLWDIFVDPTNDNIGLASWYVAETHISADGQALVFEELKKYIYKTSPKPTEKIEKLSVDDTLIVGNEIKAGNVLFDPSTISTGGGVDILDLKGIENETIAFRLRPTSNTGGFAFFGDQMMSFYEIHADKDNIKRLITAMPLNNSKGILNISYELGGSPRDFVWGTADTNVSYNTIMRLSAAGNLAVGSTDFTGTPPIGRIISKGSSNDGTTNIFVGRDSDEANVFYLDTDGNYKSEGRSLGTQGSDIASANDITLGLGNYFDITGTTEVQRILGTGWTAGSIITLQFDSNPNVKHGTAAGASYYGLQLAGSIDFASSAGDTLMLVFDGAWWREISRTVI